MILEKIYVFVEPYWLRLKASSTKLRIKIDFLVSRSPNPLVINIEENNVRYSYELKTSLDLNKRTVEIKEKKLSFLPSHIVAWNALKIACMDFFEQDSMFSNRISRELKDIFEIESSYYTLGMPRTDIRFFLLERKLFHTDFIVKDSDGKTLLEKKYNTLKFDKEVWPL